MFYIPAFIVPASDAYILLYRAGKCLELFGHWRQRRQRLMTGPAARAAYLGSGRRRPIETERSCESWKVAGYETFFVWWWDTCVAILNEIQRGSKYTKIIIMEIDNLHGVFPTDIA